MFCSSCLGADQNDLMNPGLMPSNSWIICCKSAKMISAISFFLPVERVVIGRKDLEVMSKVLIMR